MSKSGLSTLAQKIPTTITTGIPKSWDTTETITTDPIIIGERLHDDDDLPQVEGSSNFESSSRFESATEPMQIIPEYGPTSRYRCYLGKYHFATNFYNRSKDQAITLCQRKYDCDIVIKWLKNDRTDTIQTGYDIGSMKSATKCPQNSVMRAEIAWEKN